MQISKLLKNLKLAIILIKLLYYKNYMIFKDRKEAGEKLAQVLINHRLIKKNLKNTIVVSLLRGGFIVGYQIAKKLSLPHLPLPVAKISTPHQKELAIGALCFNQIYWEKNIFSSLNLSNEIINQQIKKTKEKFDNYCLEFNIKEKIFSLIKNKVVVLVDDGIATGSSVNCAFLFLKSKKPKKLILASPVAPSDFTNPGFDEEIILFKDPYLSAVSQYYQNFFQVKSEEIKKLISNF